MVLHYFLYMPLYGMPTGADTTVYHSLQLELARLGLSPKNAYYYFPTEKLEWEISPKIWGSKIFRFWQIHKTFKGFSGVDIYYFDV